MSSSESQAKPAIAAILVLIPLIVFFQVGGFSFVHWDDDENITANRLYQPTLWEHVREIWTQPYFSAYIPVTRIVWGALATHSTPAGAPGITTFDPHAYHIANLVLHLVNVLLVFQILRVILASVGDHQRRKWDWAAGLGALVFAVHPIQVEAIAWVTGMKDILCGFFSLLAILLYLNACNADARTESALLVAATISYILALLSKSSAVTLPLIVVALDYLVIRKESVKRHALIGLWLVAAIAIVFATHHAEQIEAGAFTRTVAVWQRPFVMGDTYAFYLSKIVAPFGLGPDYGRTPTRVMQHGSAYVMVLAPILPCAAAYRLRSRIWPTAACAIFILTLLPVSGIVPFAFQEYSTVSDRYMYLAMLGPALVIAGIIAAHPSLPVKSVGAIVILILAGLSIQQARYWTDTASLFQHALKINPNSSVSYYCLANLFDMKADQEAQDGSNDGPAKAMTDLDSAIALYGESIKRNNANQKAQNNLGHDLAHQWELNGKQPGDTLLQEARLHLETAARLNETDPKAHLNLGNLYCSENRFADAAEQFKAVIRYDPTYAKGYFMLGVIDKYLGDPSAARYIAQAANMGYAPAQQMLGHQ